MRISGIYNLNIAELLHQNKIQHWGFDLRPLSMSFVQGHVLEECLRFDFIDRNYYLKFENEKDFMIESFIDRLQKNLPRLKKNSLCLEFTDKNEIAFYESFKLPFVWHYKREVDYQRVFKSKEFLLLSLSIDDINAVGTIEAQYQFLNHLFTLAKFYNKKLELRIHSKDDFKNSICDFYEFDSLLFEINSGLETSYRRIDEGSLNTLIEKVKKNLNI